MKGRSPASAKSNVCRHKVANKAVPRTILLATRRNIRLRPPPPVAHGLFFGPEGTALACPASRANCSSFDSKERVPAASWGVSQGARVAARSIPNRWDRLPKGLGNDSQVVVPLWRDSRLQRHFRKDLQVINPLSKRPSASSTHFQNVRQVARLGRCPNEPDSSRMVSQCSDHVHQRGEQSVARTWQPHRATDSQRSVCQHLQRLEVSCRPFGNGFCDAHLGSFPVGSGSRTVRQTSGWTPCPRNGRG